MVETIRLESGHTLTGIVGSNPTLSAILLKLLPCELKHPTLGTGLRVDSSPSKGWGRWFNLRETWLAQ